MSSCAVSFQTNTVGVFVMSVILVTLTNSHGGHKLFVTVLVDDSYEVMLDCWRHDPDVRPTFTVLVSRLDAMLTNVVGNVC